MYLSGRKGPRVLVYVESRNFGNGMELAVQRFLEDRTEDGTPGISGGCFRETGFD